MTMNEYEIIERLPTVAEHQFLWKSVGWGDVDTEMTKASIAGSIYGVVAVHQGITVGMGRIVGDGAMYFYIQDVAVVPEHQASGVGSRILEQILAFIGTSRCPSGNAFIGLFASEGKEKFYEKYGFRDYSPGMTGMFTVMDK
ncbi:Acetyltransferase (GNAT) family protein [compost metagenome]